MPATEEVSEEQARAAEVMEQPARQWPTRGTVSWVQAVMACLVCREFKSSNEAD